MTQMNFNRWFTPPTFADEEKNRLVNVQHAIFWGTVIVAVIFGLITLLFQSELWLRLLLTGLWLPVAASGLILLHRGAIKTASLVYVTLAWLILTLDAWLAGGVLSPGYSSYTVLIVVIGLLAGLRMALLFAGLSVAMGGVLVYIDSNAILPVTPLMTTPVSLWLTLATNFIIVAVLVYLATGSITNALKRARTNETDLLHSNRELQTTQTILRERTGELATAVELLEIQLTERQQILESLARGEQELRQLNLELEQRVQDRTSELVDMNEALTQEISTRRQAELALQETLTLIERAKREWEVTVDAAPQFIGLLDREGRLKRANRTVERWNLAPVTQIRGQTVHQLFHPNCTEAACPLENLWRQASQKLHEGQPWQGEIDDEILERQLQWQVEPISTAPADRRQPSDTWGVVIVQDITERKRAEAEIRKLSSAVEQSPSTVVITDLQGRIEFVNPRFSEITGYTRAEVIGQNPRLLKSGQHSLDFYRELWQTILAGQVWRGELINQTREGELYWDLASISPVRNNEGRVTHFIKVAEDITERKQAEARLRESEAKFRSYIEHAPLAVFVSDGIGRYVEANQFALDMLGYEAAALYDKRIPDIVPEEDHPVLFEAVAALRSNGYYEGELRQRRRDGQQIWISMRAVKISDDRFMAFCNNITDRKHAEEALRESEARYRLLADNVQDVIWLLSPDGRFTYVSPSVEKLRGYTPEEVLRQSLEEALTPTSLQVMQKAVTNYMAQIQNGVVVTVPSVYELEQPRKDGSTVWTEAVVKEILDEHGNFSGYVGVSRDISERRRTEQELAHYRRDLEELVSERTAQLTQANQRLQQSEAQFRHVIASISDHIYVTEITPTGDCINQYISPNVEMLTGYPPERFLADWSFWAEQVIYPADRELAAIQLAQFEHGLPGETEYRLTRANGQVIWVRDSGRVESRNGAKIVYGVVNDITARKEAEETILRYSERLEILREIEQGILSAQSVGAIIQATMSRIQRLIPSYNATVTMLDLAANEALLLVSSSKAGDGLQTEQRIKLSSADQRGARLDRLKQGQIMILEGAHLEQYQHHQVIKTKSIRSVMVVPLIYQTELIGMLNLSATQTGVFSPEHQGMAQQIADQLAIAMRQTQLYEQVQHHADELEQRVIDRTRELSALYEVTAVASQALELPAMLVQSLEQVLTALRSDVGLIWLSEGETEPQLQLLAQQGLTAQEVAEIELGLASSGLLSQVLGQNQPLVLPSLVADPYLAGAGFPAHLQTFAGAPIRVAGRHLGVVTIFGRLEKQFNLEDVALLSTVADQMGVAVENIRLREQARQAAVLAERERLARELHDSVTQTLYSLSLFAEGALEQARNGQFEPVQYNLTRIGEAAQQALKEMRLLVYELRPVDLAQEGLVGALHQRLAAVERRAGITARLVAEDLIELPLAIEQELYSITQEALNNTLKHSGATVVTVRLRQVAGEVELAIVDNGQGFDPDESQAKGGLGLRGLRERVDMLHGVLVIRSTPGQGTTIEVRVRVTDN